jgi:RHH-type proline utilization regulon transcriptional repressor/proline dehydrogenase/delta 1-pyrroline-5-carboxylate dehydrogenase
MNGQRQAISEAYLADEDGLLDGLIQKARMTPAEQAATDALARNLVAKVRALRPHASGVDAFTQEYALSSDEGVMLMCLAEALLRVPDADTQDRLIRDKLAGQDWERHLGHSQSPFVNASTWALMLTGRIVEARDVSRWDFDAIWRGLVARLGEPVIRQAVIRAVRLLGQHFVLGRTIEEALEQSREAAGRGFRCSFDMLGEAAMTRADAKRYLDRYHHAVRVLGSTAQRSGNLFEQPGISVKLTALHPRFEYFKRKDVLAELIGPLAKLCAEARDAHLSVTIDAEEAERLISCSMCSKRSEATTRSRVGMASASPCRPIRSARCRSSRG